MSDTMKKKAGSYICLFLILLSCFVPTVSAHIYAQGIQSEQPLDIPQEGIAEITVTEQSNIEFGTVEIPANDMYDDEKLVTVKGKTGTTNKVYSVRYENGVEVSKVLLKEQMVTKPVDEIVYVGTKTRLIPTIAGTYTNKRPLSYKRYIDVSASAYDLSYASCGKRPGDRGYGITASGMRAAVGVVAVDPRVIPLGTKLYIEAADGSWVYGEAIAGDTGGAIRGNRVDLFFNSYNDCIRFGRRNARVYIL